MNRTDRLHAIHEALRRAGRAGRTAFRLAEDFEVSMRTIKRDMSALQQIGVPIWAQPGPGGGYVLDASASLPPVAFTPSQAVAVATALAVFPPGSPFSADARAASAKVFDTLGANARARAEALAGRVWVLTDSPERTPSATVFRSIERSLAEQLTLSIRYGAADGTRSKRAVEPVMVAWANSRWYLVAHCRLRNDIRWFRFDRIERADVSSGHYEPRPTADLGEPPVDANPVA